VKLRPDDVGTWRLLGFLQGKNDRFDDCVASLSKAIELKPDQGWTFYNRSRCYFKKGDKAKAVADAQRSCSLGVKEGCKVAVQIREEK